MLIFMFIISMTKVRGITLKKKKRNVYQGLLQHQTIIARKGPWI